jgi:hypothetical protein
MKWGDWLVDDSLAAAFYVLRRGYATNKVA